MLEPLFDLVDQGSHLLLLVALPGVAETDIDVTLEGKHLVVRAERPSLSSPVLHREIERGILIREVELPWSVILLHSSFEDGILRLQLGHEARDRT